MSLKSALTHRKVFLVGGKRTPFGKFGGTLKDISPVDLAVAATKATFNELKVDPETVDHYILGNVIPTTTDSLYGGRHLGLKSGSPLKTPGVVVNRLCGSGIQSILDGARLIALGEAESVVAAGTENMSNTPHLTYGGRFGTKYGALKNIDMLLDALTDQYTSCPMGITAENLGSEYKITREECDEFSLKSHQKAAKALEAGFFNDEICSVEVRKGVCEKDEHLRADVSLNEMQKLRSSFKKDGLVTAASASGIVDGAASVFLASEDYCQKHNLKPLAQIVDGAVVGVDPKVMGIGPVPAIRAILEGQNKEMKDIDLFEINEAFAAQVLSCSKELSLDQEKLNIWGGAIALGHPLGASGTRIALTLARQLRENKKELGIACACIGGGQGIGLLLKRVE